MSFKSNVDSQIRGFWYASSGDDNNSGESLEVPKATIQAALDESQSLIPVPSNTAIALVSEAQGGVFTEDLVLYDSVLFEGTQTSIITTGLIGVKGASQTSFKPQTIVNSTNNATAILVDGETAFGITMSSLIIRGDNSKGLEVTGSNEDLFFTISQVRMAGTSSIGIEVTGDSTTPMDFNFNTISFSEQDETFFHFDPSSPSTVADVNVSSVFLTTANPTGTTAFLIEGGTVKVGAGSISAETAANVTNGIFTMVCCAIGGNSVANTGGTIIYDSSAVIFGDLETIDTGVVQVRSSLIIGNATNAGDMSIKCDSLTGDITNTGAMFVIIGEHIGNITNNGTINGIINGVRYGNWINNLDQEQLIYVSKTGNDSNSGLNINTPKLTISEAISDALLLTPAVDNQITIEVIDTGTYNENVNLPEWVHINAVNAAIDGRLTIEDNTISRFRRLLNSDTGGPVVRKINGLGFAKVEVDLLIVAGSSQEGMKVDMGVAHINAGVISISEGIGIKAKNGSRVSFIISEVQLLNGALGIGTRTAGGDPNFFSGDILYAKDDGTCVLLESRVTGDVINIKAGSLIVDTLYDMGANTTLNVFATEASGSIIADPTAVINSTLAGGDTNTKGWGFYADDETSTQVVTTTDLKLLINGLASNTNEEFLPKNNGPIWDIADSKMTPDAVGSSYNVRIELGVTGLTGNPSQLTFKIDIGGMATPTNVIAEQTLTLKNSAPQSIVVHTPVFCLDTFVANGAQAFMSVNLGTLTITSRNILLVRTS